MQWSLGLSALPWQAAGEDLKLCQGFRASIPPHNLKNSDNVLKTEKNHQEFRLEQRQWRDVLKSLENHELKETEDHYISLLSSCSKVRALPEGKRLHAHIIHNSMEKLPALGDKIAQMYIQCGSLEDAETIMQRLKLNNWLIWASLTTGYIHQRRLPAALKIFQQVISCGFAADNSENFFTEVLSQFTFPETLLYAKKVHSLAASQGLDSRPKIATALLKMYVRCGKIQDSRKQFDSMQNRSTICWTVMMSAYIREGLCSEALQLLKQSLLEGVKPNEVTFLTALNACSSSSEPGFFQGKKVHHLVAEAGLQSLTPVCMSLIKMYGKCGSLIDAREVFDGMKQRDVAAWTVMIASYSHYGKLDESFELLKRMDLEGDTPNAVTFLTILRACKNPEASRIGRMIHECILDKALESDIAVGTGLVNMYAKWGSSSEAQAAFDRMQTHDVSTWNCLLAAYSQNDQGHEALNLYSRMQLQGIQPDELTLNTIIDACTGLKALEEGSRIHQQVADSCVQIIDFMVETALITFYGKCGDLAAAFRIFETLSFRDNVTWNTMIVLYHESGNPQEAAGLFRRMQQEGMRPCRITLLTVLNISGSLSQAKFIHSCVRESGFELDLEVSNSMISIYGKFGDLDEAVRIFERMIVKDVISWTAAIGAYAGNQREVDALEAFERMQDARVHPSGVTFILVVNLCRDVVRGRKLHSSIPDEVLAGDEFLQTALVNMYARCGSLENASAIFNKLKNRDAVLWTTMVAAYAQHGCDCEALEFFWRMQQEGAEPDSVTFVSVLAACSHGGILEAGLQCFVSIGRDYGLQQTLEHYGCLIDLVGRAGQLREAENFIRSSRFGGNLVLWMTLLGASRVRGDAETGKKAALRVLELDPHNTAAHVAISYLNSIPR